MKLRYDVVSHMGNVRTNNEDMALVFGEQIRDSSVSFTFNAPDNIRFTAIVSDGMGGYECGEIASSEATSSFEEFLNTLPSGLDNNDLILEVKKWVNQINARILEMANGSGMGCTFCGIFIYEGQPFVINIGDSRIYRLRHDLCKVLTTDHSERNRTGDMSIPSNLIYNALGINGAFADISLTKLVAGDRYIICSDGLNDMIDDTEIESLMRSEEPSARQFVERALAAGGRDNVTVVLLDILEEEDAE